jgi:aspartate beta-hydroxylase
LPALFKLILSSSQAKDGLGSAGHDAGDWNVLYLFLHNVDFRKNRELCPKTAAIIETIDGHYDHAFFSALAPGTHVKKHHGPTNKKLRCHLPLVVPESRCRLRAGDEIVNAQEGKCFVFDDSFEHEAWNDDDARSRIVLIIDVWHPDLSAQERKFLGFLRNAQLRMDKTLCQDSGDNFYSIIQTAGEANASPHEAVWS